MVWGAVYLTIHLSEEVPPAQPEGQGFESGLRGGERHPVQPTAGPGLRRELQASERGRGLLNREWTSTAVNRHFVTSPFSPTECQTWELVLHNGEETET